MPHPPRLILASTSPTRKLLLERLGIPFELFDPALEEALEPNSSVEANVARLSEQKAHRAASTHPQAWCLGGDQLLELDAQPLGKPQDEDEARRQWLRLRGRTHWIRTGLCLLGPSFRTVAVVSASIRVRPFSNAELDRYLRLGEWKGCAGGYQVEGRAIALFDRVDGDFTGIQGLPLLRLAQILRSAGFEIP